MFIQQPFSHRAYSTYTCIHVHMYIVCIYMYVSTSSKGNYMYMYINYDSPPGQSSGGQNP